MKLFETRQPKLQLILLLILSLSVTSLPLAATTSAIGGLVVLDLP